MSSGYILILAVLILGGVIATLGDRIGTRVGKARLSLFNLRPRRTATLVTILTGAVISASTLAILLATNDRLWKGVFDLERIERRLNRTRVALEQAKVQQSQVEQQLNQSRSAQVRVNQQLSGTRQRLQEADQLLRVAVAERSRAQAEIARTQTRLSQTQNQLGLVSGQALKLRGEIGQLQAERNRVIAEREEQIRARDAVIAQRESRLKDLETQQEYLAREIQRLEAEAQGLRQGNVAIQRGDVLASAVVRVVDPARAQEAVDQLLREANRAAIQRVRPGINDQIIQITQQDVEKLIDRINNGQDYVVRIFSAANYLLGETPIQVFTDALPNRIVFPAGDVVAATSIDASVMSEEQIQQRINFVLAAANFRARSAGIVNNSVDIGRIQNLVAFVEQLKRLRQNVELKAITSQDTYTAGPLRLELIAEQNGQILFRTQDAPSPIGEG